MFERRHQPLLPAKKFLSRILIYAGVAFSLIVITVLSGAISYHCYERLSWIDSVLNAVLVMAGLGLTVTLQTAEAKLFTIIYAVCSAIIFFATIAIFFAPLIHRAFHHFHLDIEGGSRC